MLLSQLLSVSITHICLVKWSKATNQKPISMIMRSEINNNSLLIKLWNVTLLTATHLHTQFSLNYLFIVFLWTSLNENKTKGAKKTTNKFYWIRWMRDSIWSHESAFIVFDANLTIFTIHKSDYNELRRSFSSNWFFFRISIHTPFFSRFASLSRTTFSLSTPTKEIYIIFQNDTFPRTNLLRREQILLCECNSFNGLAVGTS